MLIYNFQKEFIGIDEKDLISLGYKNLAELKTDVSDFADFFVKTPGYIHNFQHVHWIDFITCSESYEESKVIMNVNNKNYKANITITTAYLMDNPTEVAYIINLNNLRELSHQENESVANDVIQRPSHSFEEEETKNIFNTPEVSENFNDVQDVQVAPITPVNQDVPLEIDMDTPIEISLEIEENDVADVEPIEDMHREKTSHSTFDPSIASRELGLPLDLIEEFIQDFILQAKEFKDELYASVDAHDLDKIKILSHKLKGVAANLRIEDALETLSIINTSSDINIIIENLDLFYIIIAQLSGEEVPSPIISPSINVPTEILQVVEKSEEELIVAFKEEEEDLYSDPVEIIEPLETVEPLEVLTPSLVQESISYSKETIANEIGLDNESFNTLFDDYIQESRTLLASMQEAMDLNDFRTIQAEALRLRGMSDNMRINSFSDELELLVRSTDTTVIANAIIKIEAIFAQLSKLGA